MEEGDSLRRLLHTATASSRSPVLLVEDNLCEGTASPLQNSLLATLLPGSREPLQASERPFTLPIAKHLQESSSHPLNLMQSRSKLSSGSQSITNSLQELQLNAVHCESLPISQVKNASHRTNMYGSLISVTRHCIAYVLNDRKIRLIAQENAAMGLMELHESTRLPIIDIAWNQQALQATTASGLKQHPSQQLLASLSRGGEVCIGSVFAESASNLVYEPISATTFPELQPAKGLVWNDGGRVPLLALYGSGPEIYLLSVGQSLRSAALTTDLKTIEAVIFGDNGGKVFISSHEMIAIISVESIDETFTAQTIPLPPRVGRVWLHAHSEGVFCVATLDQGQLFILPLFGDLPEVIISIPLPGPQDELFAVFDQVTNVLAIGSMKSTRLLCVSLEKLSDPIVAIGSWPNETSAVSVFATSQLHNVFSKVGDDADMYLYAFHEDSVKMHRLRVSWESTKSADEPDTIPRPSNQILRPASTGPAPSIPKIDASVGNDINRGLLKMKHGNTSDDPKSGKSSTRREPTPVERFSAMNFSGTSESIDSVLKQSIAVSVSRLESVRVI